MLLGITFFCKLLVFATAVSSQQLKSRTNHHGRQITDLSLNTSVLPPGWSGEAQCYADCGFGLSEPLAQFLLGPSFVNNESMTIELCVSFCDQEGLQMAGLVGTECQCANIFNPDTCFESDFGECTEFGTPCVGNPAESCGYIGDDPPPQLINIFFKGDLCNYLYQGGAALTSGDWRLVYFYNDSISARALPHNAVDLHPPLERGNLTIDACTATCAANGFVLAGVEYADECYCGNELENNSQPIPECGLTPANIDAMPCKGNPDQFCGGPNLLYIYTLPGSSLSPIIPFDSVFDGFCGNCNQFGSHE